MEEEEGKSNERSSLIGMMKIPSRGILDSKMMILISSLAVVSFILLYFANPYNNVIRVSGFSSPFSLISSSNTTILTSNKLPIEDHLVHDKHYSLRKALKAASTTDRTVILTTLNSAWAEPGNIFDIFLESFKNGKNTSWLLNHLLVVAVDKNAYSRCQDLVSHCYLFEGGNHSTKEMAREASFMSHIYLDMMWERLGFLHTVLTLGYNFVFTDTDVMWFRDPFPHFYPNVDFQTSCDKFNGIPSDLHNDPNNGFNFVRSNNRTIEFYKFWVSSRHAYPGLHEQAVFNMIKNDAYTKKIGTKIMFLDTDYFGGFCSPSKDFNKVCTMHANCCVGLKRKIDDLNTISEDWKRYMFSSTNKTKKYQWRAPHRCPVINKRSTGKRPRKARVPP